MSAQCCGTLPGYDEHECAYWSQEEGSFAHGPCRMVVTAAHTEKHILKAVAALDAAVQSMTKPAGRGAHS